MADISKITIESGTYDIKDSTARSDIADLSTDITNLETNIDAKIQVQNKPNNMNKVIFIGDSYGELTAQDTWIDIVIDNLGLTSSEYYRNTEGSTGFLNYNTTTNHRFINLLQDVTSDLSSDEKSAITHIIVCGGANDIQTSYTVGDIASRVSDFIEYADSNYPNAKVYVGMIGFTTDPNKKPNLGKALEAYSKCINFGGIYLNGVENAVHDYSYFNVYATDTVHPNQNGSTAIGNAVYTALLRGSVEIVRNWQTVADSASSGIIMASSYNNIYKLKITDTYRLTNQTASFVCRPSNAIKFFDWSSGCVGGVSADVMKNGKQYELQVQLTNGNIVKINGILCTTSYIYAGDNTVRQSLTFIPYELDTSASGSSGWRVVSDVFGFWLIPTEIELNVHNC